MSAILPSSLSSKLILSCLLIAGVVAAFLAYSGGSGVPFVAGSSGAEVIVSKTSLSITEGRWALLRGQAGVPAGRRRYRYGQRHFRR